MGRKKGKGWISYVKEVIPELNIRKAQRAMKVAMVVDPDKHPGLTILSQRRLSELASAIGDKSLDEALADHVINCDFPLDDQAGARDFEKKIKKFVKDLRDAKGPKGQDDEAIKFVKLFSKSVDSLAESFKELSKKNEFLKPLAELNLQTSLHQKYSISKISWEYSCFRQKNTLSEHNWTLLISGPIVISDSYLLDSPMEHYLKPLSVHFLTLKMGRNNEV